MTSIRSFFLRPTLVVCFLFIDGADACAQEMDTVFTSANQDFAKGEFDQAALKYQSLIEKDLISPDVFYNLGTTLYRLNRPGEAMLAFRRAQFLDPTLPEARQNVEVLRNQQGFLEFSDSTLDRFIRLLPLGFGQALAAFFVWLTLVSLAAAFAFPGIRHHRSGLITLAIAFIFFSIVASKLEQHRAKRLAPESFSIVVVDSVKALTAPSPGARSVIDLPGGSEVRVIQESGPWCYVDIPGTLRGWIRDDQVESIWPIPDSE